MEVSWHLDLPPKTDICNERKMNSKKYTNLTIDHSLASINQKYFTNFALNTFYRTYVHFFNHFVIYTVVYEKIVSTCILVTMKEVFFLTDESNSLDSYVNAILFKKRDLKLCRIFIFISNLQRINRKIATLC